VATLSKGYDLDYVWKQIDRGPAKDAAWYYIQASESGGEPPGWWWGPGARALGLEPGQTVERKPYDLDYGDIGLAFPAWTGPARDAILQPPKPDIPPSPQILQRMMDRDADWEAAD
jgi:hypothetical protein